MSRSGTHLNRFLQSWQNCSKGEWKSGLYTQRNRGRSSARNSTDTQFYRRGLKERYAHVYTSRWWFLTLMRCISARRISLVPASVWRVPRLEISKCVDGRFLWKNAQKVSSFFWNFSNCFYIREWNNTWAMYMAWLNNLQLCQKS